MNDAGMARFNAEREMGRTEPKKKEKQREIFFSISLSFILI